MYFGLSFSRVGADFRGLLPPLFHTAAMKAFSTAVLDATGRCVVFACVESSYEKYPDFPSLCFIISSLVTIFGYVYYWSNMFPRFGNFICLCYECWENFMKSLFVCPSDLKICCGCNVIDLLSFKWVSLFNYWSLFFEIKGLMKRWSRILPSLFHPLSRPRCFLQWQRRYVMSHLCKIGFMWRCRTQQSWSVFELPLAE